GVPQGGVPIVGGLRAGIEQRRVAAGAVVVDDRTKLAIAKGNGAATGQLIAVGAARVVAARGAEHGLAILIDGVGRLPNVVAAGVAAPLRVDHAVVAVVTEPL